MKIITAGVQLDKLVAAFTKCFPKLATKNGSFGKCKFLSYELALFLRRRGIKAKLIHVQGVQRGCPWLTSAHITWQEKPRSEWSHYVVSVGSVFIDVTGRQFDSKAEHPRIYSARELDAHWESRNVDAFLNKVIEDVLAAQTDANRVHRQGTVKKTTLAPGQQKLATPA